MVLIPHWAWDTEVWQQGAPAANKCESPAFTHQVRVLEFLNEESEAEAESDLCFN